MPTTFIGRQPLLDRALRTVAYELLFRSNERDVTASFVEGNVATARVVSHALTEIGLDHLVGDKLAFVNVTGHYLTDSRLLECLPSDRVVLEILEDVQPTEEVIGGVKRLRDLGYTIAVDDFTPDGVTVPLRDLADIVKYDRATIDDHTLCIEIERDHAQGRRTVVERVETPEDHAAAAHAGADYFQGYFFARPTTLSGAGVASNTLVLVRLVAEINRPDATIDEIVDMLIQDVSMSIKVLRLINAAAHGLVDRISSIQHAAVLIGRDRLRSLATLVLMASIDDQPAELVNVALTRAKFCELVAERRRLAPPVTAFAVGMLSLLDAMTNAPMPSILEQISVNDDIRAALLGREGALTDVLNTAIRIERLIGADDEPFDDDLLDAQRRAMRWATRIAGTTLG